MNNWRYYETWGTSRWRINNEETRMFFLADYESDAKWLTDTLNTNDERIKSPEEDDKNLYKSLQDIERED